MKNTHWFLVLLFLIFLSACSGATEQPAPIQTATPIETTTPTPEVVEPVPAGTSITYQNLAITMERAEIGGTYTSTFNTRRDPPSGKQYLWVHVVLKNTGTRVENVPKVEHYLTAYFNDQFGVSYGYRKDYPDYTNLPRTINPGDTLDAWQRFEIPDTARPSELTFAFLPESLELAMNPGGLIWADHPVYLWMVK